MRAHPIVGTVFLLLSVGLFALGALAGSSWIPERDFFVPVEVAVPFVLWQLSVWCALFAAFFLRARGRKGPARVPPARA